MDELMRGRRFALADCNNFFVSCERRADHSLDGRPVIVLSCNDGCVISRSNEAKALGIKMCDPFFKVRGIAAANNIVVRSSDLRFYREVSAEVMDMLGRYTDAMEIYSIDEAFFNVGIASVKDPVVYCSSIRKALWLKTRIPVSIGIAPTKTLCKLASEYAKTCADTNGVFFMSKKAYGDPSFMSRFTCRDVWGIGRRTAEKLERFRIVTAADFAAQDELWLKKQLGITGLFTAWELKGRSVHPLVSDRKPPKSIMVSRSFGAPVFSLHDLEAPVLLFTVSAAAQLRRMRRAAGKISVFIAGNRFDKENYYYGSGKRQFGVRKTLDRCFIDAAKEILREIYRDGPDYRRCGVMLSDLADHAGEEQRLLPDADDGEDRMTKAAEAADAVNGEYGRALVKPAALFAPRGEREKWIPHAAFSSNRCKNGVKLPEALRFQSHADMYED